MVFYPYKGKSCAFPHFFYKIVDKSIDIVTKREDFSINISFRTECIIIIQINSNIMMPMLKKVQYRNFLIIGKLIPEFKDHVFMS
ncbi:hypothetical protein A9986_00110 [Solibacillus silvestris]|nr:hypothetical protein A9986_00110 [Solibacillus silvestris]